MTGQNLRVGTADIAQVSEKELANLRVLVRWAESTCHFGPEDFGKLRTLAAAVARLEGEHA